MAINHMRKRPAGGQLVREIKRRIVKFLCGKIWYHDPENGAKNPIRTINEGGTIEMLQHRCSICGVLFWQFGWSRWIQILDTDPRMRGLR